MTRDADGYADLASYAALGDGRTVALVADDGRIDWWPLPDVDSVPVFAALLDAEHGGCVVLQPDEPFTTTRRYVERTNVLQTDFTCGSGRVRVTDSLNTGVAGRLPWAELARRIEGLDGSVRLRAVVRPGTCLNTASPYVSETGAGAVLRVDRLTIAVRELGAAHVIVHDDAIELGFHVEPGTRQLLGLVGTQGEPLYLPSPQDVDEGIDRTVANWQAWSDVFGWRGDWDEAVRRSALALKLLIHSSSGAVIAAPTTSLPESLGGGKNWDYRYAWVRDAAYSLTALFRFGLREETHAAISWLLRTVRAGGPEPRVCYRPDGTAPPAARRRDVPGWRGIGPVIDGNDARDQLQLGVFGDLHQGRPPCRDRADTVRSGPVAYRGGAHPPLGRPALLERAARGVRLVSRQRGPRRVDPAARHQRFRPRRAHEPHGRRPAGRARRRTAPLPVLGRRRRGGRPSWPARSGPCPRCTSWAGGRRHVT